MEVQKLGSSCTGEVRFYIDSMSKLMTARSGFVNERRKEEDPSANPMGDEKDGKVGEALLSTTDIRCVSATTDLDRANWPAEHPNPSN